MSQPHVGNPASDGYEAQPGFQFDNNTIFGGYTMAPRKRNLQSNFGLAQATAAAAAAARRADEDKRYAAKVRVSPRVRVQAKIRACCSPLTSIISKWWWLHIDKVSKPRTILVDVP
jgi:hypothetical protein